MEQVIGELGQWNGFVPFGADEQAQERARLLDAKEKQREDTKCHCIGYALTISGVTQEIQFSTAKSVREFVDEICKGGTATGLDKNDMVAKVRRSLEGRYRTTGARTYTNKCAVPGRENVLVRVYGCDEAHGIIGGRGEVGRGTSMGRD